MSTLEQAIQYRQAGQEAEAKAAFAALHAANPDDALVNFHYAWLYDSLGEESNAVPHYEAAIAAGLSGEDLQGALLGLGSTYRTLGEYEKSEAVLRRGLETFPEAHEFVVFHAMTLYNLKRYHDAMSALLRLAALEIDGVRPYEQAVLLYAEDLDRTW